MIVLGLKLENLTGTRYSVYLHRAKTFFSNRSIRSRDFLWKHRHKVFGALSAHLWGAERPVKLENLTGTRYSVYVHTAKKIQIDPCVLEIFSGNLENKVFGALSAHLWGAERPVKHENLTGTRYSVYLHTAKKNSNRSIRSRDFLWKPRK